VIALNTPKHHRMGSAGMPLPNVELKLAEDGELLVKGPSIFAGYWQKPAANAECFDEQGWFKTGDIAQLDADGFLFITDRKKELLKTSGVSWWRRSRLRTSSRTLCWWRRLRWWATSTSSSPR